MSRRYFGTDGVRGVANVKLTPELCFQIGTAAGRALKAQGGIPRVVIGRDTRRSGPMLGTALTSGFCSVGVDVTTLGIVPTGCVSYIARTGEFGLGAVISASHNPAPDNGIKLIAHDGKKVTDDFEIEVESLLDAPMENRPQGADVGTLEQDRTGVANYLAMLEAIVPERLDGMTLAVDAAHGAAYELGIEIFRRLGAQVIATGDRPDGMNINVRCGATHPGTVQELTRNHGAEFGIAFDGDADRAVFSDEQGRLINGDRTMALWSAHWRHEGAFDPPVVVGTVMSNGGFERYLEREGIELTRASVGDKYVSQRMVERSAKIGGEQSGHIIFSERGPTGDGLITALEVLRVLRREKRPAGAFYSDFDMWPQLLVNVQISSKEALQGSEPVRAAIAEAEAALAGRGRINVRPSGTQPMVRVMVEADEVDLRDRLAGQIVDAMKRDLSGTIYSQVDLTYELGD